MKRTDTVLVTGGCGFIGGHIVEKLLKIGQKVIVLDIKILPKSHFAKKNLKKQVILEYVNVTNKKKVSDFFKRHSPDYVIHLVAEPTVVKGYNNPLNTFKTNIMGTINVLEAARHSQVKGMIVASSDKAYGKSRFNYSEEAPLNGDHPYDVSKSCADLISRAYYKTYNLPVVVTRFGNVYGEGDFHFDRIIPGICKSIVEKKTLKIRSDGTYVRDYLYVKDVVGGYLFLLRRVEKLQGQAFNFSSDENLSVLHVIKKAEEILNKTIPYVIQNTARNEIPIQHLDDAKIKKMGWKNKYTFQNSIKQVFEWYSKL